MPSSTHRDVSVKLNAAAIQREAQRFGSEIIKENKRLADVMAGGFDVKQYMQWEEEQLTAERRARQERIEVQHLKVQIGQEESLLARQAAADRKAEDALRIKESQAEMIQRYLDELADQRGVNRSKVRFPV